VFWLSEAQWARIEPHLPTDVRGVARVDNRRVTSGIIHVLKSGCRWCDCPEAYGPATTIYNRFARWAKRGVWENLFRALAGAGCSRGGRNTKIHALGDARGRLIAILLTGGQAHDCPPAKRLICRTKPSKRLLGDTAYDSAGLRLWLKGRGTRAVILNHSRKQPFSFNKRLYKERRRVENAFNRLKDFRRLATRYDRLARNYLASVCLVAALVWWT